MMTHLNFLQYVLQEGVLYLSWNRARDIWATMVANPRACDWDREVGILPSVSQMARIYQWSVCLAFVFQALFNRCKGCKAVFISVDEQN